MEHGFALTLIPSCDVTLARLPLEGCSHSCPVLRPPPLALLSFLCRIHRELFSSECLPDWDWDFLILGEKVLS